MKNLFTAILIVSVTSAYSYTQSLALEIEDWMLYLPARYTNLKPLLRDAVEFVAEHKKCTMIDNSSISEGLSREHGAPVILVSCTYPDGVTHNVYIKHTGTRLLQVDVSPPE
jgi:hypothetical protein